MDLSPQQAKAFDLVGNWLCDQSAPQTFYLAGYAGTGKTTLAKRLVEGVEDFTFAAYTGKAASVLTRKGCPASTIHSLIYKVVPPNYEKAKELKKAYEQEENPEKKELLKIEFRQVNRPSFSLKDREEFGSYDVIVLDEVSMVDETMGVDVLSFGCKVLVLGDPGQLPPVRGTGYFTARDPDYCLTEVHRQAAGNPVLNMATLVRTGRRLRPGHYGSSRVQHRLTTTPVDLRSAAQVIVGSNKTRKEFNTVIRDAKDFFGTIPQTGEKIICLKNNAKLGLMNGTQWRVAEAEDKGSWLRLKISPWDDYDPEVEPRYIELDAHELGLDFSEMPFYQREMAEEFDFGYAITCHKSQGSQWKNVFIQDQSWMFKDVPLMPQRWLYTALTRAEESVVVAV